MSEHESSIFPRVSHPNTGNVSAFDVGWHHPALLPDWTRPYIEHMLNWTVENPAPAGFHREWESKSIDENDIGYSSTLYPILRPTARSRIQSSHPH